MSDSQTVEKSEVSIYIPAKLLSLFNETGFPIKHRYIALYILSVMYHKHSVYFASHKATASKLGVCLSSVRRTIAVLVEQEYLQPIDVVQKKNKSKTSEYVPTGHTRSYRKHEALLQALSSNPKRTTPAQTKQSKHKSANSEYSVRDKTYMKSRLDAAFKPQKDRN